jgi:hypothetical protein
VTLRGATLKDETVEVVRSRLSDLARRAGFPQRALSRANPIALALAAPHDIYALGLADLAGGASIEAAERVGRRVLVLDGDQAIASAELAIRDDESALQVNEGPYVESTAAAIRRADQDPDLANDDYEIRVLRVPALYFMALWLKPDRGGDDLMIPLEPAPAPFDRQRKYAPDEILAALREAARIRLAFDDIGGSTQ